MPRRVGSVNNGSITATVSHTQNKQYEIIYVATVANGIADDIIMRSHADKITRYFTASDYAYATVVVSC